MKFAKALFGVMLGTVVVLVVGMFIWEILQINQPVYGDYETMVSVDKPEKIMPALSNAVMRVESKGFSVVGIHVWKSEFFGRRSFNMTVRGADEATLLKLED